METKFVHLHTWGFSKAIRVNNTSVLQMRLDLFCLEVSVGISITLMIRNKNFAFRVLVILQRTPSSASDENSKEVQVMNLIGDVRGKVAVMVDDMIDTAGESFPS